MLSRTRTTGNITGNESLLYILIYDLRCLIYLLNNAMKQINLSKLILDWY